MTKIVAPGYRGEVLNLVAESPVEDWRLFSVVLVVVDVVVLG